MNATKPCVLTITAAANGRNVTIEREHPNGYTAWREVANAITKHFGHTKWVVVCGDVRDADAKPLSAYGWPARNVNGLSRW